MPRRAPQGTPVARCLPRSRLTPLPSLVALSLIVSWNPVITSCKGLALLTPVDHYELAIFEARVIGSMNGAPIYTKSTLRTTTLTSVDVDVKVGEVVGWNGMWDAAWTLQSPTVVAVSVAGNRCDQACP